MPQTRTLVLRRPHGARRWWLVLLAALLASVGLAVAPLVGSAQAAPTSYSIWPSTTVPRNVADSDKASVTLGVQLRSSQSGWVSAVRFYKSSANTGRHTGTLWSASGTALATVTFSAESASGWQEAVFASPVKVDAGVDYVASYLAPNGRYSADSNSLSPGSPKVTYALTANQGVYSYTGGFPLSSWQSSNYYVDVVFTTVLPGQPTASPTTSSSTTIMSPTTTSTTTSSTTARPTTTTTTSAPITTSTMSSSCNTSAVWSSLESCGWPGPQNTGYLASQTFSRTVTGGYVVTTDNAVIDGWRVSGGIQVRAKNVTIRNSWVTSSFGGANGSGTVNVNPGASATIEHNLLDGQNATHSCIWHEGTSMTATANNCQGVNDGIFMWATQVGVDGAGDNFTIQDNYLHAFTTQAANGHIDGIQTEGAKNGLIRHNTIDVTQDQDSAVALWNSRKSTDNVRVEGNLMAGGGFAVYAEDYSPSEANPAGGYTLTNVTFTNNVFSTVHYACVGLWGVWFTRGAPSDGWRRSGNIVLETRQNIDNQNPTAGGRVCS